MLADYIEKKHHRYVEERSLEIKQYLDKLCKVHGNNHPELFEINEQFNQSAGELAMHMKKEELIYGKNGLLIVHYIIQTFHTLNMIFFRLLVIFR